MWFGVFGSGWQLAIYKHIIRSYSDLIRFPGLKQYILIGHIDKACERTRRNGLEVFAMKMTLGWISQVTDGVSDGFNEPEGPLEPCHDGLSTYPSDNPRFSDLSSILLSILEILNRTSQKYLKDSTSVRGHHAEFELYIGVI